MKYQLSFLFVGALFVLVYSLALLVIGPFEAAGLNVFSNPNNPINLVYFIVTLIAFTVLSLLFVKFGGRRIVQVIILGAMGYLAFYVSLLLFSFIVSDFWSLIFAIAAAAILIILLVEYPEWYIIDVFGILVGLSVIAMLGISLSIFLVIVLLIVLATYDAISVYGTKHMLDLADVVLDLKLPLVLVVPKVRNYSFIEQTGTLKEKLKGEEEWNAFFIGLGDLVMPGILVASAFYNAPKNSLIIAVSVIIGTLFGFALLIPSVVKGKPQAGLPYLCGGAILGYSVSSYLLFGKLVGVPFTAIGTIVIIIILVALAFLVYSKLVKGKKTASSTISSTP